MTVPMKFEDALRGAEDRVINAGNEVDPQKSMAESNLSIAYALYAIALELRTMNNNPKRDDLTIVEAVTE